MSAERRTIREAVVDWSDWTTLPLGDFFDLLSEARTRLGDDAFRNGEVEFRPGDDWGTFKITIARAETDAEAEAQAEAERKRLAQAQSAAVFRERAERLSLIFLTRKYGRPPDEDLTGLGEVQP